MKTQSSTSRRGAFRGVFTALVTPMKANGEVDYPALGAFVEYQIRQGIHGLIPLGSTGEYYALSADERERVLRTVLEAADGRVPVLAGTNAGATRDVVAYSRQAEALGCDGVLLAAPYYSLPTPDELFEHFRAINAAIGIPVMLYNYPGRTGVDMAPELIARLSSLSNIRYVKDSTGDMSRVSSLTRLCGDRLGVFCGCDTLALESFMMGAGGWVTGVSNVTPRSFVRLYDLAVVKKDYAAARKLYFKLLPLLSFMEGGGRYTQFVKAGCRLMGHPVGAPRPPLYPVSREGAAALRKCLAGLD